MTSVHKIATNKETREILKEAKALGWEPEVSGSGHIKLRHPDTPKSISVSMTPSDHRSTLNEISRIRRMTPSVQKKNEAKEKETKKILATWCCRMDKCPQRFINQEERDVHEVADHLNDPRFSNPGTVIGKVEVEIRKAREISRKKLSAKINADPNHVSAAVSNLRKRGAPIRSDHGTYTWETDTAEEEETPTAEIEAEPEKIEETEEATLFELIGHSQDESQAILRDEHGSIWLAGRF